MTMLDTIVVGGGIAGMTSALLSARKGRRVALVEKAPHLSPTLRGFVRDGTYLDSGFHYAGSLGSNGLLRHLLLELGILGALESKINALDGFDRIRFVKSGFDFVFPQGWDAVEQRLCKRFPEASTALRHFLARVRDLWQQGRSAVLKDYGRSLGPLFMNDGHSLQTAIERCTDNAVLRALLSYRGALYGAGAKETSLAFHSQVAGSYYESACVIQGGGRAVVDVLEAALCDAGVQLCCACEVTHVKVSNHRQFAGVECKTGETLRASQCVWTAHPKGLLQAAPSGVFSPAYQRRISDLEETPSAFVLFGRCPSIRFAGNLILASEAEAVDDWESHPIEKRPLFIAAPSAADGVSVICPATRADIPDVESPSETGRPPGYQQWKAACAQRIMQRLSTDAADLLGSFELLDVATPLTFSDWLGSPEGGLYGVKHRLEDFPLLPRTRMQGLYLSGQAVVAPGLLGALCAGFLTESFIN
jgi:all-trans-retinol 13,14-reductase